MLKRYGLELPKAHLVNDVKGAVDAAEKIGYPVVMKICSKDIVHKSDADCVFTDIWSAESVKLVYNKILENARKYKKNAKIDGVIVEKMVRGVELLMGMKQDEVFGVVIVFGIGGVMTEVIRDVSMRVAPVDAREAMRMMGEIEHQQILNGFRGLPAVNRKKLAELISKFSNLIVKEKKMRELDINPLFACGDRFLVGDARAVFER